MKKAEKILPKQITIKETSQICEIESIIVDNAMDSIILHEIDGKILYVNEAAAQLRGYTRGELLNMNIFDLLTPEHMSKVEKRKKEILKKGCLTFKSVNRRKDGSLVYFEVQTILIEVEGRKVIASYSRDITDRRRAEDELRFKSFLLDNASDTIIVHDFDGNIIYVNDTACQHAGYTKKELLNMRLQDLVASGRGKLEKEHTRMLFNNGRAVFELVHKRKDGSVVPVEVHTRIIELGEKKVVAGIARDISERKKAEKAIKRIAYFDQVTGLPNRILFIDRLNVAIARAHRNREKLTVMFIDLDNFKMVNDTFGHTRGDSLLKAVSIRLKKMAREADTVARIGGDEFTLLLLGIGNEEDAAKVAERLIEVLKPPFKINSDEFYVTASIGIAIYPEHGTDFETLLQVADIAMYEAKEGGKNRYQLYTSM